MFIEFIKKPRVTGSVLPSSSTLVDRLITISQINSQDKVIELGPGTGCITKKLLNIVSSQNLIAYELQQEYANLISQTLGIRVLNEDAENINQLDFKPNKIISSIPFTLLPKPKITSILENSYEALQKGGSFTAYLYTLNPWILRKNHFEQELVRIFGNQLQKDIVWQNLPPATIYTIRKQ